MFHTARGVGVGAARVARHAAFHQLSPSRLALRFAVDDTGTTRMYVEGQEPPWRVIRAFRRDDGGALVHLHNVSGGVLAGDHLLLDIEVGAGSVAQVTTTGATLLYRHLHDARDSEQEVQIRVQDGGLLEYLPDALIPFAGSRHLQRTSIQLGEDATLFWWETLAPGRHAMGETFALERLQVHTEVRGPRRKPLLLDDFVLEPAKRPLASEARLGAYTHTASFYACRPGLAAGLWRELQSKLNQVCSARSQPGAMIWGATTLVADGIAVRGLSASACEIPATLHACWAIARRFLTGTEPIPPRKVY